MKKSRLLSAVCACMFAVMESAFAVPVTIQIEGVLSIESGSSTDTASFDGASIRVQYLADTTDVPGLVNENPSTGVSSSQWLVTTVIVDVTNRPDGKQDLIGLTDTNLLTLAENYFPPATPSLHDYWSVETAGDFLTEDSVPFRIWPIQLDFGDQNFFSGTTAPADLSFFERLPTDVTSFLNPNGLPQFTWVPGGDIYSLTGAQVTNTVVPIPATAWLFGSGLLGLVGMARRKGVA